MQFDDFTMQVLKNFASINENLVIEPGNILCTVKKDKALLANAKLKDEFPIQSAFYQLNDLLRVVSMHDDPIFDFGDSNVKITWKSRPEASVLYHYTSQKIVEDTFVRPGKSELDMPKDGLLVFEFNEENLSDLKKASSILALEDVSFILKDGQPTLRVHDGRNETSQKYDMTLNAETSDIPDVSGLDIRYKIENWNFIPGDYHVKIVGPESSGTRGVTCFEGDNIRYWTVPEADSNFGD